MNIKLKEMTQNQLRKLVIGQDKIIKDSFRVTEQILHDWKFWTKINMGITVAWFMLGIAIGLMIGMK